MFFQVIQPLLAKGLKFNLSIEADDSIPGNVIVGVFPDAGEKSTSLTPAMFSGTPQELDAQFDQVMAGFVTVTKSLTEQLEDARLVAEQAAKDALASAAVVQNRANPPPLSLLYPLPPSDRKGMTMREAMIRTLEVTQRCHLKCPPRHLRRLHLLRCSHCEERKHVYHHRKDQRCPRIQVQRSDTQGSITNDGHPEGPILLFPPIPRVEQRCG